MSITNYAPQVHPVIAERLGRIGFPDGFLPLASGILIPELQPPVNLVQLRDVSEMVVAFGGGLLENGKLNALTCHRAIGASALFHMPTSVFDGEHMGPGSLFFSGAADKKHLALNGHTEARGMSEIATALGVNENYVHASEEETSLLDNVIALYKKIASSPLEVGSIVVVTHDFCAPRTKTLMERVFRGDQVKIGIKALDSRAPIDLDPSTLKYPKRELPRRIASVIITAALGIDGTSPVDDLARRQEFLRKSRDKVGHSLGR